VVASLEIKKKQQFGKSNPKESLSNKLDDLFKIKALKLPFKNVQAR